MNQYKKANVVMLATENKSKLFLSKNNELINFGILSNNQPEFNNINQNICITSNDEIKKGDCILQILPSGNHKIHTNITSETAKIANEDGLDIKKIIATTDNLIVPCTECLKQGKSKYLSQPSKQWIEYFISEYNKGNIITDVLVEYEYIPFSPDAPNRERYSRLKINPDNTINIKPLKPSLIYILKGDEDLKKEFCDIIEDISISVAYDNWNGEGSTSIKEVKIWVEKNL